MPPTVLADQPLEVCEPTAITVVPHYVYAWYTPGACLAVYRSVAVEDTDELYEPVQAWMSMSTWSAVDSGSCEDSDMVFGEANWWLYQKV